MCDIFILCFVLSEILSFFVFWVEFQCCCCCGGSGGGGGIAVYIPLSAAAVVVVVYIPFSFRLRLYDDLSYTFC
jgi:hypothetical protein